MKKIKHIFLLALLAGFTACDVNNELDEIPADVVIYEDATSGAADFSNYVALGASFTAGFSDGSLFLAAQSQSFPSIISQNTGLLDQGVRLQGFHIREIANGNFWLQEHPYC